MSVLHRHALESVLGFLSLRELHGAVQVCAEWRRAVGTMRPINGALFPSFQFAAWLQKVDETQPTAALLDRHVGTVGSATRPMSVSPAELSALAIRFPQLLELHCHWWCPLSFGASAAHSLQLPARGLRTLQLTVTVLKDRGGVDEEEEDEEEEAELEVNEVKWNKQVDAYVKLMERVLESIGQCEQLEAVRLAVNNSWNWPGRQLCAARHCARCCGWRA